MGKQWKQGQTLSSWAPKWMQMVTCSHEILQRFLFLGRKAMTNLDSLLKSTDITLPTKVLLVKDMIFSSSHVWMWELDHKESWTLKKLCFWTVVLEKTLESPLACRGSNQSILKEISVLNIIGRTDAEVETPILWPPDAKKWLIRKDPDVGKYWMQEEGMTEDEVVG